MVTSILRRKVLARDSHRCVYCGSTGDLTLDHIKPRSQGGGDEPTNLLTSCSPCNNRKKNAGVKEFAAVVGGPEKYAEVMENIKRQRSTPPPWVGRPKVWKAE